MVRPIEADISELDGSMRCLVCGKRGMKRYLAFGQTRTIYYLVHLKCGTAIRGSLLKEIPREFKGNE